MEHKKIQPLITLSFVFIVATAGVGYYLDLPLYKKLNEQNQEISRLEKSNKLKDDYEQKIQEINNKLKEIDWETRKEKIEINFDSSPFFLSRTEIFFKDLVLKSGMTFSSINFGQSSPIGIKQQAQSSQENSSIKEFKPQEGESNNQATTTDPFSKIKGPVEKTSFTLSMTGNYDSFKGFLVNLEKQAFLISVKTIAFSPSSGEEKTTFSVTGEVYSY